MKAYVKSIIGGAALGMALLTTTVPTWAGFVPDKLLYPGVSIGQGNVYGSGAVARARYSLDTTQYIGCAVSEKGSYSYSYMSCTARDQNGTMVSCGTYDPKLIKAAHAITNASDLYFYVPSGTATCTYFIVGNSSVWLQ